MLNQFITPIMFMTVLGAGLTAGIMYTFSYIVMEALGKLPAHKGIAAMQSINIVIINPLFLLVFMGTAALSLLLGGTAILNLQHPSARWQLAGALLFILGVIVVTATFNIPLNDALAKVDPTSVEGAHLWEHYLAVWTRWNHVRTLSAIASVAAFILALRS